ncbi:MAG: pyruvate kinase [Bdellovibrionales bacterium]
MLADKRVKIVATIGPATKSEQGVRELIISGMDVARLNFSHGTHEDHHSVIQNIRKVSTELNASVAILQDLQGPKIRVGKMKDGVMQLKPGESVIISTQATLGENGVIPTDFKTLPQDCKTGTKILLDDGLIELKVEKVQGEEVHCTVIYGGPLKDRKGMNIPGANLSVDCLTPKDLQDLEFGLSQKVDYVALSFVRRGEDMRKLRSLVDAKNPATRIIAKIEMLEALDNLEDIVRLSDAVMVARGDLATEVGASLLPGIQKEIISLCNQLGRPVITATQMLESMIQNPTPTRAEVTDIANAVLDGSDALMLSAETASGQFPFKCVQTMGEVIREVERTGKYYYKMSLEDEFLSVAEAIAASACLCAKKLNAAVIVCLTTSGKTATLISKSRPKARIIAVTHLMPTLNRLELVWGIHTIAINPYDSTDSAIFQIEDMLLKYGVVKAGDKMILTMGMPVMERGTTNSVRVYTVKGDTKKMLPVSQRPLRFR